MCGIAGLRLNPDLYPRLGSFVVPMRDVLALRGPDLPTGIDPPVRLFGYGIAIEMYKNVGPAAEIYARYGVADADHRGRAKVP
jgi:hypothetical protein